ncbi:hypothetical protein A6X21_00420 [Planctopirus hydrillae]|uniref:Uncharacterized protein n=1 Tax=Planctopirus hydrillae TaxID=1841610 RepID=A0A1C3EAX5_9PLAN|nr:hypothetical protein A6X21_00420 [Planctopirus hydrillae]
MYADLAPFDAEHTSDLQTEAENNAATPCSLLQAKELPEIFKSTIQPTHGRLCTRDHESGRGSLPHQVSITREIDIATLQPLLCSHYSATITVQPFRPQPLSCPATGMIQDFA